MSDDQLSDAGLSFDVALPESLAATPMRASWEAWWEARQAAFRRRRWLLRYLAIKGIWGSGNEAIERAVQLGVGTADEMIGSFACLWEQGCIRTLDNLFCMLTEKGRKAAAFARTVSGRHGDPPVPIPSDRVPDLDWTYALDLLEE